MLPHFTKPTIKARNRQIKRGHIVRIGLSKCNFIKFSFHKSQIITLSLEKASAPPNVGVSKPEIKVNHPVVEPPKREKYLTFQ